MYNLIKKSHGTRTRAVNWKCCLRGYSRVTRFHDSLEIISKSSLFSTGMAEPKFSRSFHAEIEELSQMKAEV